VKYWGKRDLALNLPAVSSLSLTLDRFSTETEVVWGAAQDRVTANGEPATAGFRRRALAFLDRLDPNRPPCTIDTVNNFPTAAGLASSSSGFAALTLAAATAAGHDLPKETLSVLARQGSGSACRSLWGGFVEWRRGTADDGSDSHGVVVAPAEHWDLCMVAAIVSDKVKGVSSTEGMERSRRTSPYYQTWVDTAELDVAQARSAVLARDLPRLGRVMESSTYKMHAVMHTSVEPIIYWHPNTVACLHAVRALRKDAVGAWATMDAGPNVKVLCERANADKVAAALREHVDNVVVLGPGGPASLIR
jgi:diphosphomevalonate decarboxylase